MVQLSHARYMSAIGCKANNVALFGHRFLRFTTSERSDFFWDWGLGLFS